MSSADLRLLKEYSQIHYLIPHVEAGKKTSTVIPAASPKRRRKGNRISLR
jgi:hypothetical protein